MKQIVIRVLLNIAGLSVFALLGVLLALGF